MAGSRSLAGALVLAALPAVSAWAQPAANDAIRSPLQAVPLAQLRVVAVAARADGRHSAMVRLHDQVYLVRVGQRIGSEDAAVVAIDPEAVILEVAQAGAAPRRIRLPVRPGPGP